MCAWHLSTAPAALPLEAVEANTLAHAPVGTQTRGEPGWNLRTALREGLGHVKFGHRSASRTEVDCDLKAGQRHASPPPTCVVALFCENKPAWRPTLSDSVKSSLQSKVVGRVMALGDDGYDDVTRTWDLSVMSRPPLAVAAATVEDIAVAARWADARDLGVAVRNTGHGAFSADEDALVISTTAVNRVDIDG